MLRCPLIVCLLYLIEMMVEFFGFLGILQRSSIFKVSNFILFLNCDKARFDGNSELVAELVTVNGFKAAYAIKDGAEGPRGWKVKPQTPFSSSAI